MATRNKKDDWTLKITIPVNMRHVIKVLEEDFNLEEEARVLKEILEDYFGAPY